MLLAKKILALLICCVGFMSCMKKPSSSSKVSMTVSKPIDQADFSSVYRFGNDCTVTFISESHAVTTADCLKGGRHITSGDRVGSIPTREIVHPKYDPKKGPIQNENIGVAIFPPITLASFSTIKKVNVDRFFGYPLPFVGFGADNPGVPNGGVKREGKVNFVAELSADPMLVSQGQTQSTLDYVLDKKGMSLGLDSERGAPVMIGDFLVAIWVGNKPVPNNRVVQNGHFLNLSNEDIYKFIKKYRCAK